MAPKSTTRAKTFADWEEKPAKGAHFTSKLDRAEIEMRLVAD